MSRKFECRNCGTIFEAADNEIVKCPRCDSDNVDYAHYRVSKNVWKVIMLIISLLLIVFAFWGLRYCDDNTQYPIEQSSGGREGGDTITKPGEYGLLEPPKITVGDLVFEKDGYSFEVNVENSPKGKYYYIILDTYDNNKEIARCNNGKFEKIPPSEADGGTYDIALRDASCDSVICKINKPGFIVQKAVTSKMSLGELQKKIDDKDESLMGVGKNDYLSPECKIEFIGLPKDALNVPTTMAEVFEKLDFEVWTSVKVTALEYDDMNRISKISMRVTE